MAKFGAYPVIKLSIKFVPAKCVNNKVRNYYSYPEGTISICFSTKRNCYRALIGLSLTATIAFLLERRTTRVLFINNIGTFISYPEMVCNNLISTAYCKPSPDIIPKTYQTEFNYSIPYFQV